LTRCRSKNVDVKVQDNGRERVEGRAVLYGHEAEASHYVFAFQPVTLILDSGEICRGSQVFPSYGKRG
jgi:hypothetical protein